MNTLTVKHIRVRMKTEHKLAEQLTYFFYSNIDFKKKFKHAIRGTQLKHVGTIIRMKSNKYDARKSLRVS